MFYVHQKLMPYADIHLVKDKILFVFRFSLFVFRFSLFVFRFSIIGLLHDVTVKGLSTHSLTHVLRH